MNADSQYVELFAANEDAATYCRRQLLGPHAQEPRDYLLGRGFEALLEDTPWTVGYAPGGWTSMYDELSRLGYSDDTLINAGLVTRTRRGNLIDRFRDRITFGIRDTHGALRGFTARRGPHASEGSPKYLNTATTPIYCKREQLFGLGESLQGAPASSQCVITEGPLDAIAIALSTSDEPCPPSVVALCGTALSRSQATSAARGHVDTAVLALDPDAAGARATLHAFAALAELVSDVRVTDHHNDADPAEVFHGSGADGITSLLATTVPAIHSLIDECIDTWPALGRGAEADISCLRQAAGRVAMIRPVDAAAAARRLVERLAVDAPTVTRELTNAATRRAERLHAIRRTHIY